jgi:hypothetical protein
MAASRAYQSASGSVSGAALTKARSPSTVVINAAKALVKPPPALVTVATAAPSRKLIASRKVAGRSPQSGRTAVAP